MKVTEQPDQREDQTHETDQEWRNCQGDAFRIAGCQTLRRNLTEYQDEDRQPADRDAGTMATKDPGATSLEGRKQRVEPGAQAIMVLHGIVVGDPGDLRLSGCLIPASAVGRLSRLQ